MSGVRVRGVTKSFRSFRREQRVLRGVDLDIQRGEVVGLIGPNGAGKTTLMSCILGYLHNDGGEITIDDRPSDDLAVRGRTAFVPERMNFDRTLVVGTFLQYLARLNGLRAPEARQRVELLLERMSIAEARRKRMAQLSRGMLQRVMMVQALVNEPDYLFLDEPASGLDPNGVLLVRDVIREHKARGAAVLLNSHQLSEVEKVCDRVFFLSGGVVVQSETLRGPQIAVAVTLLPGFDSASVGAVSGVTTVRDGVVLATASDDRAIAALVTSLVRAGAEVVEVKRHVVDLEAFFREQA